MWKAVIDDSLQVYPEEIRNTLDPKLVKAPQYLVELKKSSLIEKFIEASLEYNNDQMNICLGGLIHKLLEVLNKAHISVVMCMGSMAIRPAANAVPAAIAKRLMEEKPLQEQRQILAGWDKEKEATQFRESLKQPVQEQLKRQFDTLIDQSIIDEIVNTLEYIPRPVMHSRLSVLIDLITTSQTDIYKPRINSVTDKAKHIYDEADRSFQEDFELLHREFILFLAQLTPDEVTKDFANQVEHIDKAEQIAACPNELICYLSAEQIPHLTATQIPQLVTAQVSHVTVEQIPHLTVAQVPYLRKDKLQHVKNPKQICSISKWDFVYLDQDQLQHRPDLGTYTAIISTVGAVVCLASLVSYVALPIVWIISRSTEKKVRIVLNLNLKRLQHLFVNIMVPKIKSIYAQKAMLDPSFPQNF